MAAAYDHSLDNSVVKWTDVLLLGVLGLCALALAPQLVARLRGRSEWWTGLVLYSSKPASTRDDSSSITARNSRDASVASLKGARGAVPHTRSLAARLPRAAAFLRRPLPLFGRTLGQTALLLLYFGVLLFAALYRGSVFKDSVRAGALAAAQLPWVYALATKNNVIGALLGRGYEKLNYLHRWAGALVVLAGNVHAIGFIYKWTLEGKWVAETKQQYVRWGLVALVALDVLLVFALGAVRRHHYNLFYASHSAALVVLLIAISKHQPFAIPYVAIAAGLYGADHALRLAKSRAPLATLEPLPELHTTLVRIPALTAGWRAGQHVRVRVLSRGMGAYAWLEPHTFTIAGAPGGEGALLLAKRAGAWTRALYALAQEGAGAGPRRVRLLVEGPYGGPGFTNLSSFSGAIIFCGGSGISYGLAVAQELLQRAARGESNILTIELVWCATHAHALTPLLDALTALLAQAATAPLELSIRVSYTRAPAGDAAGDAAEGDAAEGDAAEGDALPEKLPHGLALAPGRASVAHLLAAFVARTRDALSAGAGSGSESGAGSGGGEAGRARGHGVLLATCGPAGLAGDARAAIADLNDGDRERVGGVELHDEAFHW
ncbi:iron reductase [Phanerochaete sordida]|uniref:ferric-chelate reductase (NADPH) n=1 Tax=Phanerochaete sordida TaxID=48140 RepID=A0A9P3GW55_9APHY|nr:iron reductase [Phanerochaete sordida]